MSLLRLCLTSLLFTLPPFLPCSLHCTPLNEYIFVLQFGGARSSYDLPLFAFSFTQVSFGCPCYVRPLSFSLSSSPALSRCAIIGRNATRCLLRLGHSEIHIIDVCMCVYVHTELLSNYAKHELCLSLTCVCVHTFGCVCVCNGDFVYRAKRR